MATLIIVQVPLKCRVQLVSVLDSDGGDDVHPVLSSILMDAAMEAIDMMSDQESVCNIICYGNI